MIVSPIHHRGKYFKAVIRIRVNIHVLEKWCETSAVATHFMILMKKVLRLLLIIKTLILYLVLKLLASFLMKK